MAEAARGLAPVFIFVAAAVFVSACEEELFFVFVAAATAFCFGAPGGALFAGVLFADALFADDGFDAIVAEGGSGGCFLRVIIVLSTRPFFPPFFDDDDDNYEKWKNE